MDKAKLRQSNGDAYEREPNELSFPYEWDKLDEEQFERFIEFLPEAIGKFDWISHQFYKNLEQMGRHAREIKKLVCDFESGNDSESKKLVSKIRGLTYEFRLMCGDGRWFPQYQNHITGWAER